MSSSAVSTSRRQLLRYLPVVLLCVGIASHGVRILAWHDDPQRGTAFAMFATVDIAANRRVQAVGGDPAVELRIPESLRSLEQRLMVAPSTDGARRLAERLVQQRWNVDGDAASAGPDGELLDEVHVRVVGPDADGRTITRAVLAEAVVTGGIR